MPDQPCVDELNRQINDILERLNHFGKDGHPFHQDNTEDKRSGTVIVPSQKTDDSAFGGDPRNAYRELRRFLMDLGIDTRIFSFGTIPIPIAVFESRKSLPTIAVDVGTLDNCFFFELRKVIETSEGGKVNAMVIMFRVFFEGAQDSNVFWVQAAMNHHRDAILELNRVYSKVIPGLLSDGWTQPTAGREGTRITYFEKRFTDVIDFRKEFRRMYASYKPLGLGGNLIEPHA